MNDMLVDRKAQRDAARAARDANRPRGGGPAPAAPTTPTTPTAPVDPNAPTPQELAFQRFRDSSGYQFRIGEGYDALNAQYAARGQMESGAAQRALLEYGQNYASGEFGNYMNYLGNQQSLGATAASSAAGIGSNFANTMSNANTGYANAMSGLNNGYAAGVTGLNNNLANAQSSYASNVGNIYSNQAIAKANNFNSMLGGIGSAIGGAAGYFAGGAGGYGGGTGVSYGTQYGGLFAPGSGGAVVHNFMNG